MYFHELVLFGVAMPFSSGRGAFLAISAAGNAWGLHVCTPKQTRDSAGLHGACSGHSKSRGGGYFCGIYISTKPKPSRPMEANTDKMTTDWFSYVLLCITAQTSGAATTHQPHFNFFPLWQQRTILLRTIANVSVGLPSVGSAKEYVRRLETRNTHIPRTAVRFQLGVSWLRNPRSHN